MSDNLIAPLGGVVRGPSKRVTERRGVVKAARVLERVCRRGRVFWSAAVGTDEG